MSGQGRAGNQAEDQPMDQQEGSALRDNSNFVELILIRID